VHKSRLSAIGIDCQGGDLEAAGRFWSAALGREASPVSASGKYVPLAERANQPTAFVQKVDHPSRVHLDIETDDVEAEVERLEALGATRVEKVKSWWILEAPTGHRFCVVLAEGAIAADANAWD